MWRGIHAIWQDFGSFPCKCFWDVHAFFFVYCTQINSPFTPLQCDPDMLILNSAAYLSQKLFQKNDLHTNSISPLMLLDALLVLHECNGWAMFNTRRPDSIPCTRWFMELVANYSFISNSPNTIPNMVFQNITRSLALHLYRPV